MTPNTWLSERDLSDAYARHEDTLRGAVRHALVARAVFAHLPAKQAARVLDVGGGDGHQATQLARAGHHVTLLDPDEQMLRRAAQRLEQEPEQVRGRVVLVQGRGEDAADLSQVGFDLVCCHGVLMYTDDPGGLVGALVAAARPGGLISVLTKNSGVLALRPALEGRWADALAVMGSATEVGNLGVATCGHTVTEVTGHLAAAGAAVRHWYGVRVFTDHLGDTPIGEGFDQILQAEWEAGQRDPYREVARLIHLIAARTTAP